MGVPLKSSEQHNKEVKEIEEFLSKLIGEELKRLGSNSKRIIDASLIEEEIHKKYGVWIDSLSISELPIKVVAQIVHVRIRERRGEKVIED